MSIPLMMTLVSFMFQIRLKDVVERGSALIGGILSTESEHVTHRPNPERVTM
jgi:hypothetical protein